MSVVITYKDRGWAQIQSSIRGMDGTRVRVGVIGDKASEIHPLRDNITIGEVALINEYGSAAAGVPSRPFIRPVVENRRMVVGLLSWAAQDVLRGHSTAHEALHRVGQVLTEQIKQKIRQGVPPPNAPLTVAKKGHGLTLRDTYTLLKAISYELARSILGGGNDYESADVIEGALE